MNTSPSTTRAVSTAFGLVMVASAAVQANGPGLLAAGIAAAAVLAGSVFRPAATVAVLATVVVIVVTDAPPVLTATAGLCAAAFNRRRADPAAGLGARQARPSRFAAAHALLRLAILVACRRGARGLMTEPHARHGREAF